MRPDTWIPRAENARGKVLGALPRIPARGTPPETPGPLSLLPHVPERCSPSRVRFAAPNYGAPLTAARRSGQMVIATGGSGGNMRCRRAKHEKPKPGP